MVSNLIIGIVFLLLIVFIFLFRFNTMNIRNGFFGKKVRILLKDADNKKFINSMNPAIKLFYSGVVKEESSFNEGITIWIPRNSISSIIILQGDNTIKVEKINTGVETEKVIEINTIEDKSVVDEE